MVAYRAAAPGITDRPVPFRETSAGVVVGSDGVIVLEVEEQRFRIADDAPLAAREYAEVPLSIDGATRLRDALDAAIAIVRERRAVV